MIWAEDQEWGTAADLAQRFKVTVWTIYKWRSDYGLATTRISGRDYSSVIDAAVLDRDMRDATRGRARQLDSTPSAA